MVEVVPSSLNTRKAECIQAAAIKTTNGNYCGEIKLDKMG